MSYEFQNSTQYERVETLHRVDRLCVDFENSLQASEVPDVAELLEEVDPDCREGLLRELLLLESCYLPNEEFQERLHIHRSRFEQYSEAIDSVISTPSGRATEHGENKSTPQTGMHLRNYELLTEVGRGGFGRVFKALNVTTHRQVALKTAINGAGSHDGVQMIREELATLARLNHPGILLPLDHWESRFGPVMVFPLASGTLRNWLSLQERNPETIVTKLIPVIHAVEHAHSRGVVHRDIEPDNILVGESGQLHLSDFGLAIHETVQSDAAGQSAGSMAYMSPELIRGESHWLDGRADIWALGVVLYESLTGRRPFTSNDPESLADEILGRSVKPLRQVVSTIPSELERICLKCLVREPGERFLTAGDLADDLEAWIQSHRRARLRRNIVFPSVSILAVVVLALLIAKWPDAREVLSSQSNMSTETQRIATVDNALNDLQKNGIVEFDVTISRQNPPGSSDSERHQTDIRAVGALPLRPGDQFWLDVEVPIEYSVNAFLIDVHGKIQSVEVGIAPNDGREKQRAWLPAIDNNQSVFKVGPGDSGTEAIVLVTRPSADKSSLQSKIPDLLVQTDSILDVPEYYHNGHRDIRGSTPTTSDKRPGAEINQRRIWDALQREGYGVYSVVYGFQNLVAADE